MKKVITIITAALMMTATANAQNDESISARNSSYKKGYHFSVELGMGLSDQMSIATSHGYNFGNGFYIGGGAAVVPARRAETTAAPTFIRRGYAAL